MTERQIIHDVDGDVLYLAFVPGESATGLSLSDQILLRVDQQNRRAIGITFIGFSQFPRPRTC